MCECIDVYSCMHTCIVKKMGKRNMHDYRQAYKICEILESVVAGLDTQEEEIFLVYFQGKKKANVSYQTNK